MIPRNGSPYPDVYHNAYCSDFPIWPESNVTFGYLGTLNTWAKRFNFL
jgi:hypothetical protein